MGGSRPSWENYLRVEFVGKAIDPKPTLRQRFVLDAGAGTSRFVHDEFSAESQVLQVDVARNGRIDVACSVTNLPFRDEAFDVVLAFRVLQHVPAETEALEEILRVTKAGGQILVAVANRDSWTMLGVRLDNPKWRKRIPYPFYRLYRREELETKLRETGFVPIRIWSAIFLPEAINRLPVAASRALIKLGVALDRVAQQIPFIRDMGTNWVALGVKS